MKIKYIWMLWGWLFAITALVGFLPAENGLVVALMVLLAAAFFITGVLLLVYGRRETWKWVRNCAIGSLALTLLFLVLNIASVQANAWVGQVLHGLLTVVSAPMLCCQAWGVSLFLWACLLFAAVGRLRKKN